MAGFGASGSGGQGFAVRLEADGDTKLGNSDGDLHQFTGSVSMNDNVFFLTNGRLGINTSAPDYKLSVAGNVGLNEYIYHNGDADTYIQFEDDAITLVAGSNQMINIVEASQDKITFNNGSNDVDIQIKGDGDANLFRTIASSDRIGIGTNAPSVLLDVSGSIHCQGQFARGTATKDLGSGTTSTITPSSLGAGTVLITASSVTTPTEEPNESLHICTIADGTTAGELLTLVLVTTALDGSTGAASMGVILFSPTNPLNSGEITTVTGEAAGGVSPIGSTAQYIWTGSKWARLSMNGSAA